MQILDKLRRYTPQKQQPIALFNSKKVVLSVWWDIKKILYYELLDNNQTTIGANLYCQQRPSLVWSTEKTYDFRILDLTFVVQPQ